MIIIGLVFWLAESIWFGWHQYPSCEAEVYCDHLAGFLILVGCFRMIVKFEVKEQINKLKK